MPNKADGHTADEGRQSQSQHHWIQGVATAAACPLQWHMRNTPGSSTSLQCATMLLLRLLLQALQQVLIHQKLPCGCQVYTQVGPTVACRICPMYVL